MNFDFFMGKIVFVIFIILGIVAYSSWIYMLFYGRKLCKYLKKHKKNSWRSLIRKSTKKNKPLYEQGWRTLAYIRNDKDMDDKNIRFYKKKMRFGLKWSLIFLCSIPLLMLLITIIVIIKTELF